MEKEMKKLIILAVMLLVASPSFAGFNWGVGTYENYDDILIINSLGDQTSVSKFGLLGTNDWIPENAVKNYLALEGYTTAIDYNPSVTNPQFASDYNQAVPAGYTKLTFAGLLGDPRATQDVYVKTEEYNRLNSEMQAQQISQESKDRINGDKRVQDNLDKESTIRSNADTKLQNNIDTTNSRIDDTNNRVSKLEDTQNIVGAEVRVLDTRKWTVSTFVDYTTTRNTADRVGVRFTYKLGSSYEERRADELEARLNRLEGIQTEQQIESDSQMYTTDNGIGIRTNF